MSKVLRTLSLFLLGLFPGACASLKHESAVELSLKVPSEIPPSEQKQRLLQAIDGKLDREAAAADLLLVLEAEELEAAEQWYAASQKWLQTLKTDNGFVAAEAFKRWIKSQVRILGSGATPGTLAGLLYDDISESAWMRKEGLNNKFNLNKKLETLHWEGKIASLHVPAPLLGKPDDIANDLYWEKAAKAVCLKTLTEAWSAWVENLTQPQKNYWKALLLNCRAEYSPAAEAFGQAVASLRGNKADLARAVKAAELQIANLKSIGDRVAVTKAYRAQYELLRRSDLPLDLLGWSAFEKTKKAVEAGYWVGRYQAMHGNYSEAIAAVNAAMGDLKKITESKLKGKDRAAFDELRVDGYHILASRVAYEQKDMASALNYTRSAQGIPGLSLEWKQRLLWAQGWYNYTGGNRPAAVGVWKDFLVSAKNESEQVKALYWIGRAQWENGDRNAAETSFDKMRKKSPLSFYSVVGLRAVDPKFDWFEDFPKPKSLAKDLDQVSDFQSEIFRNDAEAMRRLLRLELALSAQMRSVSKDLALELFRHVSTRKALLKELEGSLYVSRVLHMSGQNLLSISLTTSILDQNENIWSEYPEQILIFFPEPFMDSVKRAAEKHQIDKELIFSIARQESSFRADAESPVGALGLMQLMPATAKSQSQKIGIQLGDVERSLKTPDINIQLGSAYLANLGRRYQMHWPKAFAAYNAGEYATDAWSKRRSANDMILWAEALSFGETSGYVKNVWRNLEVYKWLNER